MIDRVDELLHRVLKTGVADLRHGTPAVVDDEQIAFRPPDETWRSAFGGLSPRKALDVYLVDLRENRRLRSNEYVEEPNGVNGFRRPAPARIDCHYLITAWSNATEAHGRTVDEHRLLYQSAAALFASRPLLARRVLGPQALPANYPAALADAEIPLTVLPVDGFPKLGDLWGNMGARYHWKPAVYAVLTVPVVFDAEFTGPAVTTLFGAFKPRLEASAETETVVDIGGVVADTNGVGVGSAWVRLETVGGELLQTAATDERGRFVLTRIAPEQYVLRAGAPGVGADTQTVDIPSVNGKYDLKLA